MYRLYYSTGKMLSVNSRDNKAEILLTPMSHIRKANEKSRPRQSDEAGGQHVAGPVSPQGDPGRRSRKKDEAQAMTPVSRSAPEVFAAKRTAVTGQSK